jgi:hypothetical protein
MHQGSNSFGYSWQAEPQSTFHLKVWDVLTSYLEMDSIILKNFGIVLA